MPCNAEEIAEKRRIALERLQERKKRISNQQDSSTKMKTIVPRQQASATAATSTAASYSRPPPYQKPAAATNPQTKLAPVFTRPTICTFSMVSEERFKVEIGFNETAIAIFKTIPSKSYDPATKLWTFSIADHDSLAQKLTRVDNVVIRSIPRFAVKVFQAPKSAANVECLQFIEPKLIDALLPFQAEGVRFGIEKQGRCLIADEMGLGKTYQALAIADFYRNDWPLLICTTASTRDAWANKIRELLPRILCSRIVVLGSTQDSITEANVLICSYTLMEKMQDRLLELSFGVIIMDESHTLKNFKAKCTAVAEQLCKRAKRIILLSGTPALSRPKELFTQLQLLDPTMCSFKEFSLRYCEGKQTNFGWNADGQSNLEELNLLLRRRFMIRRTKEDVESSLVEKTRETILLDPMLLWSSEEESLNMSVYAEDYKKSRGKERDELLLRYYSATGEAKGKAVCAYLTTLLKSGAPKFIVFGHHLAMLNAIGQCLNRQRVNHVRIDGATRGDLRTQFINEFQTNNSCRVALLSLKACSSGITLTAAKMVIFAELDWTPSTLEQAESRAHRIGQLDKVEIKYLLAKGTADDVIWPMIQKKQQNLGKAGLCNEDFTDATNKDAPPSTNNTITKFFNPIKSRKEEILTENSSVDATESKSTQLWSDDEDFDAEIAKLDL